MLHQMPGVQQAVQPAALSVLRNKSRDTTGCRWNVGYRGLKEVFAVVRQVLCNYQKLRVTFGWVEFPAFDGRQSRSMLQHHITTHSTVCIPNTPFLLMDFSHFVLHIRRLKTEW